MKSHYFIFFSYFVLVVLLVECTQGEKKGYVEYQGDKSISSVQAQFFSDSEIKLLKSIQRQFEEGLCNNQNRAVSDCYKLSAHAMKFDIMNQNPLEINYPFNSEFSLNQFQHNEAVLSVWNNDCAMSYDNKLFHYYCINKSGPAIEYLKKVGKSNSLIHSTAEILEKPEQEISTSLLNILIELEDKLDFNDEDHRMFFTILILSVNEEFFQVKRHLK